MPSIDFESSLKLMVFQNFADGGGQRVGTTPGSVSFSIGPNDSWTVYAPTLKSGAEMVILAEELDRFAVPKLQIVKATLSGSDLSALNRLAQLETLYLSGGWSDGDLLGLKGLVHIRELVLDANPVTDAALVHIGAMSGLKLLSLIQTRVTGTGLVHLSGLAGLDDLLLAMTPFNDRGCALLDQVPGLKSLQLPGTAISDTGVASIATKVRDLHALYLDRNAAVTNLSVPHLQSISQLQVLSLDRTGLNEGGVLALLALDRLTTLDVRRIALSDAVAQTIVSNRSSWQKLAFANATMTELALQSIDTLSGLNELALNCPGIGTRGLAPLSGLTRLVDLDLSRCRLDDAALRHLVGLTDLRNLNIADTGGAVSEAGIAALAAQLPKLKIWSDYS